MMSKMLNCFVIFGVLLCLSGYTLAQDISWNDGEPGDHLWSSPANWDLDSLPALSQRVKIEIGLGGDNYPVLDATIFEVDPGGAFADRVYVGDGGSGELLVTGGAKLTIDDDLNIAYGNDSHGICRVSGSGTLIEIADDIKLGRRGEGTLEISGGRIDVSGKIEIPSATDTASLNIGHLQLSGGVIDTGQLSMRPEKSGVIGTGTIDVDGGMLILAGDATGIIQQYIDNGWITGYGGDGAVHVDYDVMNAGKTTVYAMPHLVLPNPSDGSTVSTALDRLEWTLPDPNRPGISVVTCDVYWGTDPNHLKNPQIVTGETVEWVSVSLAPQTMYYWSVDVYDSDIDPVGPFHESPVFTFNTFNKAPTVDAGADVATWLADGPRVVSLDGIASDDGMIEPLTYSWTMIDEPDSVSNPALISDPNASDPMVTATLTGTYTLQLVAYDGEYNSDPDTMEITVYSDSCEHAWNQEGFVPLAGDTDDDCDVDMVDLANFSASWLEENYSIE